MISVLGGALLGWAARPPSPLSALRRSSAPPERLVVLGPPEPGSSWWKGARLGLDEARRLVDLLDEPFDLVEEGVPGGEAGARVRDHADAGGSALVAAFPEASWKAVEEAAVRAGSLLVDARATHPAEAPCSSTVFRVGVPLVEGAGEAAAPRSRRASPRERLRLWDESLFRYGATQLNERFRRRFDAGMDGAAWAAWFAVKAVSESVVRTGSDDPAELRRILTRETGGFDGHKGRPLRFRPRDHRLVQPLYATTPDGVEEVAWPESRTGEPCDPSGEESREGAR